MKRLVIFAVTCMFVFVFPALEANASSDGESEQDSTKIDIDFIISLSGTYSSPKEIFSENYESAFGWAASAGILISKNDTTASVSLAYYKTCFNLSNSIKESYGLDESAQAAVTAIMLEGWGSSQMFSVKGIRVEPTVGGGLGGCRFELADKYYEAFGNSTLTELRDENNKTKFCEYQKIGLLLHDFGPLSLQYSYQLISVHRKWKYFHWFVSSSIKTYLIYPLPEKVAKAFDGDVTETMTYRLIALAYRIGITFLWYDLTYEQNNWPFDDEPPMHFHRQSLALSLHF